MASKRNWGRLASLGLTFTGLAFAALPHLASAGVPGVSASVASVHEAGVTIDVDNRTPNAISGSLIVSVDSYDGSQDVMIVTFAAPRNGRAYVQAPFAEPVRSVLAVGVVLDDGTPFGPN